MNPTLRTWLPDLGVGLAVAFMGIFEAFTLVVHDTGARVTLVMIALAMTVAGALVRQAPAVALAVLWLVCVLQVSAGTPILMVEMVVAPMVAFGTARWGTTSTVWLSALSMPAAAVVAVLFLDPNLSTVLVDRIAYGTILSSVYPMGVTWRLVAAALGIAFLGLPWLAGLALRFGARARQSEVSQVAAEQDAARAHRETEQAQEIAHLREEQARLARDVHDVVGHSLAVILAQAESAQFVGAEDTERLKQTMETIATSARTSLQDVRQVLSTTAGQPAAVRPGGLDSLVEGVRASGHRVEAVEIGTPRPLPPEVDVVAFRVLQEMLTNAIKHGRRGEPVHVERHWEGELRLEVRNVAGDSTGEAGQGLEGMRRRLESVGGRLDVRRRSEQVGPTFTVTAWIPLGAQR
ncbi:sensor histidine kinase [Nocardioides sp.]|uniref:sensor histidine kinase n=1 Tax=Nocardioides sp. TaxID=35761 RepID=UPI0035625498